MESRAKVLGHAAHPMLNVFPPRGPSPPAYRWTSPVTRAQAPGPSNRQEERTTDTDLFPVIGDALNLAAALLGLVCAGDPGSLICGSQAWTGGIRGRERVNAAINDRTCCDHEQMAPAPVCGDVCAIASPSRRAATAGGVGAGRGVG